MTSQTGCIGAMLRTGGAEDALGNGEHGSTTRRVSRESGEGRGDDGSSMPGVRDLSSDRLQVLAALETRTAGSLSGAESQTQDESETNAGVEARAGHRVAAPRPGLGSREAPLAAESRDRDRVAAPHGASNSEASRAGAPPGLSPRRREAMPARGAEPEVADGWPRDAGPWDESAVAVVDRG